MNESIIHIDHLSFEYEENVPVINDITFDIQKGKYTVILGHNGSGKSTIAKLIMGLLEAKSGKIIVDGLELNVENIYDIREKIGIVFQNPDNQFIGSTVRDDIAFGLENICVPQEKMDGIIQHYSRLVQMEDFLDHEPSNLSGGQKQRVAIAGCLAMDPSIMIMDEATSMLDPKGRREINRVVQNLKTSTNKTIISITHDIEEAVFADEIILLNKGKIMMQGSPKEVLTNEELLRSLNLDVPFAYKVSSKLNMKPMIDRKELVEALCQFNSKM